MRIGKATLAVLLIAAAMGSGAALARGGGGGGGGHSGGGHSGGGHFGGGHGVSMSGSHVSSFSARAPMTSFSGAHSSSRFPAARRVVVAAPLLAAPYYPYYSPYYGYSPGYDSSYGYPYPYDEPPMYGPDPGYDDPPPYYGPPPPPPPASPLSSQSRAPAQRNAGYAPPPTPIYYCADSRTYTNVIADLECPAGWRKVM
jgi:hypothetical protein